MVRSMCDPRLTITTQTHEWADGSGVGPRELHEVDVLAFGLDEALDRAVVRDAPPRELSTPATADRPTASTGDPSPEASVARAIAQEVRARRSWGPGAGTCLPRRVDMGPVAPSRTRRSPPPGAHGTTPTSICGIGVVGAATIVAIIGDVTRFPTVGHFAAFCGTAPLEASSGEVIRHRLSRRGDGR